jgi:hypothetical protein
MSTLTLELKDDQVERLKKKAGRLGLSLETFASKVLGRLSDPDKEDNVRYADWPTFERMLADSFAENDEAYRRLAQ